jgi:hypothetical protein
MTDYDTGIALWTRWTQMWNDAPALALELVAPRFALHLTSPSLADPATICDPAAVARWVAAHRARFDKLVFSTRVGPFVDTRAGVVAGPWIAETIVGGVATPVCGIDAIAFVAGKVTEYWTMSKPVEAYGDWATATSPAAAALP